MRLDEFLQAGLWKAVVCYNTRYARELTALWPLHGRVDHLLVVCGATEEAEAIDLNEVIRNNNLDLRVEDCCVVDLPVLLNHISLQEDVLWVQFQSLVVRNASEDALQAINWIARTN